MAKKKRSKGKRQMPKAPKGMHMMNGMPMSEAEHQRMMKKK